MARTEATKPSQHRPSGSFSRTRIAARLLAALIVVDSPPAGGHPRGRGRHSGRDTSGGPGSVNTRASGATTSSHGNRTPTRIPVTTTSMHDRWLAGEVQGQRAGHQRSQRRDRR